LGDLHLFDSIKMIAPKRSLQQSNSNVEQQNAVIAASTAIMGENVLDSPNTQHLKSRLFTLRNHSTLQGHSRPEESPDRQPFPPVPNIQEQPTAATHLSDDPFDSNSLDTTNNRSNATDSTNALSVGIMAQGLAWAQMQRNRRQRLYLQHQAEQQLEKMRLAEEKKRASEKRFLSSSISAATIRF
jgi:hypothetical protein